MCKIALEEARKRVLAIVVGIQLFNVLALIFHCTP